MAPVSLEKISRIKFYYYPYYSYLCGLNCEVVKYLKQYRIPFAGLKLGKHVFDFDIDRMFFDCFDYSIVKDGKLKAEVILQKQERMMIVDFHITGDIMLTCDVCLSVFPARTVIDEKLIVKFTDEDLDKSSEEILVLSRNEYELDVSVPLYEYINLAVPHYKKCSEQGENISCDALMIAKLNGLAAQQEAKQETDPRWEALKNIKNN